MIIVIYQCKCRNVLYLYCTMLKTVDVEFCKASIVPYSHSCKMIQVNSTDYS